MITPREKRCQMMRRLYARPPRRGYDDPDAVCLPLHVWLVINDEIAFRLTPSRKAHVMQQLHVNETATISLIAVDVYGNIVDAALSNIQFSNSNEDAAKSSLNDDGSQLTLDPATNGVGRETTVSASAQINGTNFSAEDAFTVVAGPVAGIQMITNFNPKSPAPAPSPT